MSGVCCAVVGLITAQTAWATTCAPTGGFSGDPGHYYSSEMTSDLNEAGIEGDISVDSLTLGGAQFEINWIGGYGGTGCANRTLGGLCSIQAGYGSGNVGGYISRPGLWPYMEEEDVNGYDVNWPTSFGLTQDNFVSVSYIGQTSNGGTLGQWSAYIKPSGGSLELVGRAYFPVSNGAYWDENVSATTESYYATSGTCAPVSPYEYYGTDGAGGVTVGSQLQANTLGPNWEPMYNYTTSNLPNAPYAYQSINTNIAFRAWGS